MFPAGVSRSEGPALHSGGTSPLFVVLRLLLSCYWAGADWNQRLIISGYLSSVGKEPFLIRNHDVELLNFLNELSQRFTGGLEILLAFLFAGPQGVTDRGGVGILMMLHRDPDVRPLIKVTIPEPSCLVKASPSSAGMGTVFDRLAHVDRIGVVSPGGTGLNLTRMPARCLFRRPLEDPTHQGISPLGRGLVPAGKTAGLIPDFPQNIVDYFRVAPVVADEDDLVKPVIDHAHRQIIDHAPVCVPGESEGSGSLFHSHPYGGGRIPTGINESVAGFGDWSRSTTPIVVVAVRAGGQWALCFSQEHRS